MRKDNSHVVLKVKTTQKEKEKCHFDPMSHSHPFPPICEDNWLNISFWIHPSCISSCRSEKTHIFLHALLSHVKGSMLEMLLCTLLSSIWQYILASSPGRFMELFLTIIFIFCSCIVSHCVDIPSVQFSLVAQSCLTLCDPMNCSMPELPVHHQLPESTQTHVRWVSDAIQPSHPLSSPSPPALNLSQHQGLFQWVSSSRRMAKVLELQLRHRSFKWIFRTDFL